MVKNVSKQIVSKLKPRDMIAMEILKGIRRIKKGRKLNKWLHNWSYYQLQPFITYKAIRKGISIAKISPTGTSKKCSKCRSINTERHSGFFTCLNYGYHLDSDLNASYNIAQLYMRNLGKAAINQPNIPSDDTKAQFVNWS